MTEIQNKSEAMKAGSSFFDKFNHMVSLIENVANYIGMFFIIMLMLMVVMEVLGRYLLKKPIHGYVDLMEMFMVVLVFLTLSICQREGGHIRMEMFLDKGIKSARVKKIVNTFFLLVSFGAILVITIYSWSTMLYMYHARDSTLAVHLPTWPARLVVPIGCGLLSIRFLLQICEQFKHEARAVED